RQSMYDALAKPRGKWREKILVPEPADSEGIDMSLVAAMAAILDGMTAKSWPKHVMAAKPMACCGTK
ncbi:MAG: hypothetical protein LBO00_05165, partial [Zoogloeaceae bacterium]|nr:hypothetical protein [Zoogloeaceae bacterium]